jgi:CheY-like chemotaxis protein
LILVADDSPTIQRRAQGILQGEGFQVETVSNGVAAIKKLPKLQPILVLADVSMPGKDGYEVCDYVKTSADFRHVPVLLVGSDLEPYDEQRGAQVGADGIIKKPFTPRDLIAMVAKFAGLGEAPASPPKLPEKLATSFPAALAEVPPKGPGPEPSTRSQKQDLAALPAGVAFAGPTLDEIPVTRAEPLPDFPLRPSPEPALQGWAQPLPEPLPAASPEDMLAGSSGPLLVTPEPFPGFALEVTPEPTPEPGFEVALESALISPESISETPLEAMPEAAPEAALVSPELIPETALEAMPEPTLVTPEPTPAPLPEAAPEPALVGPELISETAPEAMPEPPLATPEPTPAPLPEAAPEPALVSPELISATAPEAMPEPPLATPEPTPAPLPEAAPEPALVSPEFISEAAPESSSEQVSVVSEPVAEAGLPLTPESATEIVHPAAEAVPEALPAAPVEEVPPPTGPITAEKQVEPIAPLPRSPELVRPEANRAVEFRLPTEFAGPVLIDELAPAPPAPELHPLGEERHPKLKVATSLDSFSLAEAAEGQVYVAPPEIEAGPPPEAEVVKVGGAPAGAPSVVDRDWVYAVVHKVVLKMAPPLLPPELVEELVRTLTEEITSELNAASSQAY